MAVMNGYTSWLESSPAAETISMVSYLKWPTYVVWYLK
jgi:hypothetical protein